MHCDSLERPSGSELDVTTYGPAQTVISVASKNPNNRKADFPKIFHESLKNQLFHQDAKDFSSVDSEGLEKGELTYIYMPASIYGFGAVLFRNSSFEKTVSIEFYGKQLGKFLIFGSNPQYQLQMKREKTRGTKLAWNQGKMVISSGESPKEGSHICQNLKLTLLPPKTKPPVKFKVLKNGLS